jgi:uncharacterized membrane protein
VLEPHSVAVTYASMPTGRVERLRLVFRLVLAAVYLGFGALHLAAPDKFVPIMPPVIPFPRPVVLLTGACEIAGAFGLLIPATRRLAGLMLALYAICVWPANIYQAFWHVRLPPLPDSWWYHAPRIALQPALVWWALFAGGAVSWPFRSSASVRPRSSFVSPPPGRRGRRA